MFYTEVFVALLLANVAQAFVGRTVRSSFLQSRARLSATNGKIVVTGIGSCDEDEFMLNLLNEQAWESVILATPDATPTRKRFLSRTARYSGLLNILDFESADLDNTANLTALLTGADAWLAFNVSQSAIPSYAAQALASGLDKAIFTMELPLERINDTVIPEFDDAVRDFALVGAKFTGIRHGAVLPGDEDNSYEIVNASIPLIQSTVERGVLARVAAELLQIDTSANPQCGLSSSSPFAKAYLNILRQSGLTRAEEVKKVYEGGVQRVARLTVASYEVRKAKEEVRVAEALVEKEQEDREKEEEIRKQKRLALLPPEPKKSKQQLEDEEEISINFDRDIEEEVTEEMLIVARKEEILKTVWLEMSNRMYTKSTSKMTFWDLNSDRALALATKEVQESNQIQKTKELEATAAALLFDKLADIERKQYAKLYSLEKREMATQRQVSDTWVRYVYLLMETTMAQCAETGALFHNLDEFQQSLMLRQKANELRALCNIPPYDVVYDPLDASAIVAQLSGTPMGLKAGGADTVEEVVAALNSKYGKTLRSNAALRGAQQIVDLAVETLMKELPPAPASVNEKKRAESAILSKQVSDLKLEATRNRGQPFKEGESVVGRM